MYVRNCWYMAGWSHDFTTGSITARTVIEEDLAIYRKTDGTLVAMENCCCHRKAPLSVGQIEGDDIRCMYHGLKFGPDGQCNEIPQSDHVAKSVRVQTYPIFERHNAAWIWLGNPAKADPALIPHFIGTNTPDWAMIPDRKYIDANYMLINDNLLDLSHVSFVHRNSFGKGDAESNRAFAKAAVVNTKLPNGMRVERMNTGSATPPYIRDLLGIEAADYHTWYEFLAPGFFLLNTRIYPLGTIERCQRDMSNEKPIFAEYSCQAVTPASKDKTCYYFALGPWAQHSELAQFYLDLGHMAFDEDKVMIEAQQKTIDRTPDKRMMNLVMDQANFAFRALMDQLIAAEKAEAA